MEREKKKGEEHTGEPGKVRQQEPRQDAHATNTGRSQPSWVATVCHATHTHHATLDKSRLSLHFFVLSKKNFGDTLPVP